MDDRRFDSLVKSLAGGASRRSVLKGLLGLGGAAAIGGTLLEGPAEAARRPTPTPRPIRCPGNQIPVNGVCTCPPGLSQCNPGVGPACCNDTAVAPGSPTYSECCDNACCNGTCYGEELCCRTNSRAGGLPPTNRICDTTGGPECCLFSDECCLVDGCCATVCTGGSSGIDNCCPVEDFCPGAGESEDLCCTGNTTCCHGGTEKNACIDLTVEDACCDEGDCGDPCKICSEDHTCVDRCDPNTQVCCTEQAGPGICLDAECCPGVPCTLTSDDDDEDTGVCCDGQCLHSDEVCNGGSCCPGGFCDGNGDCCPPPNVGCNGGTCCDGFCDRNGDCCPEGNFGCNGGKCCSVACDTQGNCPCSDADPCDEGDICCDGACLSSSEFFSCPADEAGCCGIADACCNVDGCCGGACYGGDSGRDFCCDGTTEVYCQVDGGAQCCQDAVNEKCCGTQGCCTNSRCNEEANVCCSESSFACGTTEGNECCGTETEKCCDGVCIDRSECCPSTDGNCVDCDALCAIGDRCGTVEGCECTCPDDMFCMPNSTFCCPGTSLGTNDNCRYCGDVCGVGTECESDGNGGFACVPVSCEPNCLCGDGTVDPATDGLTCNGGDGICACGWCVDPTDECPCGCDGNPDCVRCAGGGVCENYNEGGSCGDSGGVCFGAYCDFCRDIGGECNVGGQCCSGHCHNDTCVPCIPSGGSCTVNGTDCCAGYFCPGGTCVIQ